MNSTDDVDRNLQVADQLVRNAVGQGAELVVLPEKWSVLGTAEDMEAGAQALEGPCISWARATAAELGIDLVAGSIVERLPNTKKRANTSVHVGPDGEIRAVYRKLHMFDAQVDGVRYAESEGEQAGTEIVLSRLFGGAGLGLSICYDVRFPELYRALAIGGAQVISLPSAFTLSTTRDHWEVLVRCRAIEEQCFIVAANQIGAHPGGNRSGGRSLIVDPWGVVLAGAPDSECAIVADLELDLLADVRERLPVLKHRRADVYGGPG